MSKILVPGKTIGVLGGGQLGRMMILEGRKLGYRFIVLDPTENSPAAQVADEQMVAAYDDWAKMEEFAEKCDLIVYEFENVDPNLVARLEGRKQVPQGSRLLRITRHRKWEKEKLVQAKVPVAPFYSVKTKSNFEKACKKMEFPAILKTATGGYDGKGQWRIRKKEECSKVWNQANLENSKMEWILEKEISFITELSIMVARNMHGEVRTFPPTINIHRNHILHLSIAPAIIADELLIKVKEMATQIAEEVGLIGLLGVEMFLLEDGEILVNELAPRPHNSGHYTYDACNISQFEMFIRAVTGLQLPYPILYTPAVMANVLGEHETNFITALPRLSPDIKIHWYGKKEAKHGRKMGHLTALAPDVEQALQLLVETEIWNPLTVREKQMIFGN